MTTQTNQSEVARLLAQIDAEYAAAERGLAGLAEGVSRHQFMTARMERISCLHGELGQVIGSKEDAMELITTHLIAQETGTTPPSSS